MFTQKIRVASLVTLSLLSVNTAAFADDRNIHKITPRSLQSENIGTVSAFQSVNRLQTGSNYFDLDQKNYMRETYQDIELTLLGPLKFGVSEDVIQHRFSNIDVNYGSRIQRPDHANRFDNSTYLKATAATTSVKLKF